MPVTQSWLRRRTPMTFFGLQYARDASVPVDVAGQVIRPHAALASLPAVQRCSHSRSASRAQFRRWARRASAEPNLAKAVAWRVEFKQLRPYP
jgi:hypothetical protein